MTARTDGREMLKQKEIYESMNIEYSLNALSDESESEMTWIKLHQMFDK
tara:strand:- start:102 stop:248 length:147 start_codon:yes stop_codon:yes gene_type:complete